MKQENIKFNIFKIKRKKKDLQSILKNYKEEINNLNNDIDKSIKLLENMMNKNNSN